MFSGKVPADDVQLSELKIKPNTKIMMMGTCEETIAAANEKPTDIGEVIDDFDFEETEIQTNQRYLYCTVCPFSYVVSRIILSLKTFMLTLWF